MMLIAIHLDVLLVKHLVSTRDYKSLPGRKLRRDGEVRFDTLLRRLAKAAGELAHRRLPPLFSYGIERKGALPV